MDIASLGIAVDSRQSDQAGKSLDSLASSADKAEVATKRMGQSASEAARQAAKETKEFERSMTDAATKGAVIGQAISDGIRIAIRAVGELERMIRGVGDLKDLAEMSGASAAGFSRMRTAADVAGISMEKVANIAIMMTRQISAVNDESKGAGKALDALGIPIEKFRLMRPDERIFKLAEALNQVQDSGGKTALILDVVGRGGGESAKLFKALGDEVNITSGYTEELVDKMDEYADANTRASSKMSQTVEALAVEMAPAFAATRGAIRDTVLAMFDMDKESTNLGNNKGALEFAHAVGLGISHIIDLAVKGAMWLTALGKTIGALAAAGMVLLSGGGSAGVKAVFEGLNEDLANLQKRYANIDTAGAFEKRFAEIVNGEKKITQAVNSELQSRIDAYKRANDKVSKADKEAQREKEKDERERIRIGRRMAIEQGEAVVKANEEYQKKLAEARKLQLEADSKSLQNSQDEINAINDKAAALETEVDNHGRLLSAIEAEKLALMERDRIEFDGNDQALAQLEKKIEAQKRLVAAIKSDEMLKANEETAKKAGDAWTRTFDQVGQSLTDAIMQGGLSAKDMLERAFKAMVLRPAVQALVSDAMGMPSGSPGYSNFGSLFQSGYGLSMANMAGTTYANMTGTGIDGLLATNGAYGTAGGAAGTVGSTLGSALPYLGALYSASQGNYGSAAGMAIGTMIMPGIGTLVGGLIGGMFDGKGGGRKVEGSSGYNAGNLIGSQGGELTGMAGQYAGSLNQKYTQLATMLGSTDRDYRFGVGLSMDPKGSAQNYVQVAGSRGGIVTNLSAGRSEEDLKKALAEASTELMIDALRTSGLKADVAAYFDKISEGLTGDAKLQAFETAAAMSNLRDALVDMSDVTASLGNISIEATDNIVKFAGGIDNLTAGLQAYTQNFFSKDEQRELALKGIAKTMQGSGVMPWATPDVLRNWDRGTFRNMVESLDLTTDTGQRAYGALMNVAGAFATITEETDATLLAQQAAAAAQREAAAAAKRQAEEQARLAEEMRLFSIEANAFRLFGKDAGFTNIQMLSTGAAKALADMAGGIDTLKGQIDSFNQNFATTLERRQMVLDSVAHAFMRANIGAFDTPGEVSTMTREQYAQAVKAANLNTESGRNLYTTLMNLSGAFASITAAIKEPDFYTLDEAYQNLNDAYTRQKGELEGVMNAMEAASKGYKDFIASLKTDAGLSNLSPGERMTELQRQYEMARISADRDNNSPEAMQRLTGASRALLEGARGFYGSGSGYDEIYNRVISEMEARASSTEKAGSVAQQQLGKLDQQVKTLLNIEQTLMSVDYGIQILNRVKEGVMVIQGYPHADGLARVPYDNYPALLHKNESVLTASQSDFMRKAPDLVTELVALRAEVTMLRKENRQDAGNNISATLQAAQEAARVQSEATLRAAQQRDYQNRNRPVLA